MAVPRREVGIIDLTASLKERRRKDWKPLLPPVFMTESFAELVGAPIILFFFH
jgi:hypothetical protein